VLFRPLGSVAFFREPQSAMQRRFLVPVPASLADAAAAAGSLRISLRIQQEGPGAARPGIALRIVAAQLRNAGR